MAERKLGVAIHGAGSVARAHAASWQKCDGAEIVSVSSRRKETAERFAAELGLDCTVTDDYDAVLRDDRVDIVNLSGPNQVHAPQGISAARAGKHLMIEKPMCLTAKGNRALRDAVVESCVKSVVSFVLRWNPLFDNLRSLLAKGAVGELFYVEIDYWHGIGDWYSGWEWAHTRETGGSTMLLGGCHALDAIRYLSGSEVVEVGAYGNNIKGAYEYESNVVAMLKFENGMIGKTSTLFDAEIPYNFNIDLIGTEGTLRDNRIWSKPLFPGQTSWTEMKTVMPDSGDVDHHPFDAQMQHLVDCILENRESHCSVADAFHTHQLCLAIDRSIAEGGKPVRVEDLEE